MRAAFLTDKKFHIERVYTPKTREKLKELFDFYPGIYSGDEACGIPDAEVIFSTWGMPEFTEGEIEKLFPKLKVIFYGAGSVQAFARPFLARGISVSSAWIANSVPVAEYAAAQIVLANKGFFGAARLCTSPCGRAKAAEFSAAFPGNFETNVGIIGLGAIGSGVAERLKAYKLNVLAHDPFASPEKAERLGVRLVSLEEMFETCQTISNHCANLPETEGILNANLFDRMKDNVIFINTGRGAQVAEQDLIRALKEKPTRTAVLDVTFPEPPIENSELYTLENVVLTPHIAGSLGGECGRMGEFMLREAENYINGRALEYSVTPKMLETMA